MSRHRNIKAAVDDYYDDDYYDDEEYYEEENYDDPPYQAPAAVVQSSISLKTKGKSQRNEKKSAGAATVSGTSMEGEISELMSQVLEVLGYDKISKSSPLGPHISETKVRQLLEAYDRDSERVIDYFMSAADEVKQLQQKAKIMSPGVEAEGDKSMVRTKSLNAIAINTAPGKPARAGIVSQKLSPSKSSASLSTEATLKSTPKGSSGSGGLSRSASSGGGLSTSMRMRCISDDDISVPESSLVNRDEAPEMTLVVVGHVDAGKSTLVGNLLLKSGHVQHRTVQKYEKDSASMGKNSFYLAWVMDEDESEREHGVTIGIAERQLVTPNKRFTILDAPGHRDFIPNMISGATQADVALLVIPGTTGEYESSMKPDSQTREHAVLLKALGVNQIVVVVNKMEEVGWSQERFFCIKEEVEAMLSVLQFGPRAIRFVPASGLTGENLVALSEDNPVRRWYEGPTLFECIDSFRAPPRLVNKQFRAIVTAVSREYKQGCDVTVKILQGRVFKGRSIGIGTASSISKVAAGGNTTDGGLVSEDSSQFVAEIKKISIDGTSVDFLSAGQNGTLSLADRTGLSGDEMFLREGLVLFKGLPLLKPCRKFKAVISSTTMMAMPIIVGSTFDLYLHGEEIQCHIKKIYSVTQGRSGTIKRPKCIPNAATAIVKIKLEQREAYIEPFKSCMALGRFALRSKGLTAAVGVCKKVYPLKTATGAL